MAWVFFLLSDLISLLADDEKSSGDHAASYKQRNVAHIAAQICKH